MARSTQTLMPALTLSTICDLPGRDSQAVTGSRTYYTSRIYLRSHYDVLGVTPRASEAQIKDAYYRLSKKFHPDVNKSAGAQKKFSEISEAYETLGNRARRRIYDGATHGSRGGMASAVRGKRVHVEYDEFQRGAGQFKERPGTPVSGKTAKFDFDEFYRQHYGSVLDDTRNLRTKQKRFRDAARGQQEYHGRTSMRVIFIVMAMSCVFGLVELLAD